MDEINPEWNVPYYIFEEIVEYIEQTAKGHCKMMKWENIRSLLRLAVLSNRLSERQANWIEEKYCREGKERN